MEIATGIILRAEARLALYDSVRRAGEVRRPTHQLRELLGDGVDHDARGGATGDVAVFGGEDRQCVFPARGKLAAETALQLTLEIRMRGLVRVVRLLPLFLRLGAALGRVAPETKCLGRDPERLFRRIVQRFLGECDLFLPERRSVRFSSVVLVRAAVTDV